MLPARCLCRRALFSHRKSQAVPFPRFASASTEDNAFKGDKAESTSPPQYAADKPVLRRILNPSSVGERPFPILQNGKFFEYPVSSKHVPFNSLFLRDACACEKCVDPRTGQKHFQTSDIPPSISFSDVRYNSDEDIEIKWMDDIPAWTGNHISKFSKDFFKKTMNFHQEATPDYSLWSTNQGRHHTVWKVDYQSFMKGEREFHDTILQLSERGLVLVQNIPESETSIETIVGMIGPLKNTFYGRTWDVKDKPDAENVAYTSHYLGLHMDLLYMKQPPGLQLLHCLKSSCEGGESMFADAFSAAEHLKTTNADFFDVLTTFPVRYHYEKGGKSYSDVKPTFELEDIETRASKIPTGLLPQNIVRAPQLKNVNWSPPFQSPFYIDAGVHDTARELRRYHLAAQAFAKHIESPANQVRHRMDPGECFIFNNRRILHGRAAFRSGTGERFLKGAYVDYDDFKSCHAASKRASNV